MLLGVVLHVLLAEVRHEVMHEVRHALLVYYFKHVLLAMSYLGKVRK